MPELETLFSYELRDFLLFSRQIYLDLIISYHRASWPLQIFSVFFSGLLLASICFPEKIILYKLTLISFAISFVYIGKVFYLELFSTINWSANIVAYALFLQSGLIILSLFISRAESIILSKRYVSVSLLCGTIILPSFLILLLSKDISFTPIAFINAELTALVFIFYILLYKQNIWLIILPVFFLIFSGTMHYLLFT